MDLKNRSLWALELTGVDLTLTLKALGGRLTEEEVEQAKDLGDQITLIKAKTLIRLGQDGEQLLDNVQEAQRGKPPAKPKPTRQPVGSRMNLNPLLPGDR